MIDAAYEGGAERYVELLATGLDRRRFEPSVIARDAAALDAWCERIRRCDIPVTRLAMNLPFRPQHAVSIFRALRTTGAQIAHMNSPGPYDSQTGLFAPVARLASARAVCVTEHLPMVERLWKRALVKRLAYAFVDRVFTVCEANLPFLTTRQGVPVHKQCVVYNGLPAAFGSEAAGATVEMRKRFGIPDESVAFAFIGGLTRRKGLDVLIDALAKLSDRAVVIVAGDGEEKTRLEKAAETLSEASVRFVGSLSRREVGNLLCAVDALVVPSFMEGLPYVILEAMACSLPVIATDVNGIPEAVDAGRTGLLVPAGDADAMRDALEHFLSNASERLEMGRQGRLRFERLFTLERHVDTMQRNYEDLAGTPRAVGS
ncbi:MAG: glycosyltransferase family 4 protein [bacterium]|nr:glycosyltransferase family 4 protein [bacterium]